MVPRKGCVRETLPRLRADPKTDRPPGGAAPARGVDDARVQTGAKRVSASP